MTTMAPVSETFTITEDILVRVQLEKTFASLVAQLETPDGKPMPMVSGWGALHARARKAAETNGGE